MTNTSKVGLNFNSWLILITLFIISACSKPYFTKLPSDGVILAFGDSLTAGNGTSVENSYPSVLSQISGHKVINAGIPGETTEQGAARFAQVLEETHPQLVILMEGGNDILRNINPQATKRNLENMIKQAQLQHMQIMLVGIPNKSLFSSHAEFYDDLAKQYNLLLDDNSIAKLEKSPEYKSDEVHFNQQGYKVLAERFYDLLKKNGAF
ncbi:MAG: arylesterase [Neisseriaceae bacterium]|nr:MAG: arylesterase [Neisseriaceae bacterium]